MMTPAVMVDSGVNEEESVQSKKERMDLLFADGKRAYIVGDLATASDKLGEAAGLAVELYGAFASEAFYPHYYYGKTMLEMASVEDQVFTNALQNTTRTDEEEEEEDERKEEQPVGELIGNPEELNEKEQEEIAEKVAEALEENAATLERRQLPTEPKDASDQEKEGAESVSPAKDKRVKEEQNAEIVDEKGLNLSGTSSEKTEDSLRGDEIVEAEEATKGAVEADEAIEGGDERDDNLSEKVDDKTNRKDVEVEDDVRQAAVENGERREESVQEDENDKAEDSDAQDDEIEPMQLAWEALEVARTICDKHIDVEGWKEKKADVLLALGECSIQNASYKQAMEDITLCIEMYKSACEPTDRRIAEACFQKARVYTLDGQFEMAADTYTTVKQLLENRLVLTEKELAEASDAEKKRAAQKEVDSINDLIPEIQIKIDDSRESALNAVQAKQEKAMENGIKLSNSTTNVAEGADDISKLVRKKAVKRAAEADERIVEEQNKKVKCVAEEMMNGQKTTN